ncbi:hypothetical protein JW887_05920 [Candidatus Dojkabacteria bacterium]|nr:hypothetical protein [Candidatus Dojkabacteria bacterium]
MKNTKLISIIIIISLLIVVSTLVALYLTNSFAIWGVCRPGTQSAQTPSGKICYIPSGKDGQKCKTEKDCNGGGCRLVDSDSEYPGVCKDQQFGCFVWIDENGDYDANQVVCID